MGSNGDMIYGTVSTLQSFRDQHVESTGTQWAFWVTTALMLIASPAAIDKRTHREGQEKHAHPVQGLKAVGRRPPRNS
jgi:hypothetical protein